MSTWCSLTGILSLWVVGTLGQACEKYQDPSLAIHHVNDTILPSPNITHYVNDITHYVNDTILPWPFNTKTVLKLGYFSIFYTGVAGTAEAVKYINFKQDLLPNHTIELVYADSKCSAKSGAASLLSVKERGATHLLGPTCSSVCEVVSPFADSYGFATLASACLASRFLDKKYYPNLARIVPGTTQQMKAFLKMFKRFGWKRFAFLVQEDNPYAEDSWKAMRIIIAEDEQDWEFHTFLFSGKLEDEDGNFDESRSSDALDELSQRNYRIMVLLGDLASRTQVLRVAQKKGMIGDKYVWVGTANSLDYRFPELGNGFFSAEPKFAEMDMDLGSRSLNTVCQGYYSQYYGPVPASIVNKSVIQTAHLRSSHVAWDVIVSFAHALHSLLESGGSVTDAPGIMAHLANVSLPEGKTGPISFNDKGDRLGLPISVFSYAGTPENFENWKEVFEFDSGSDTLKEVATPTFFDGATVPPLDGLEPVELSISKAVATFSLVLGAVNVIHSLACLITMLVKRNVKAVARSGVRYLTVVLTGVVLSSVSILLLGLPSTKVMCNTRLWAAHLSFVLTFMPLFLRTMVVNRLFSKNNWSKYASSQKQQRTANRVDMEMGIVFAVVLFGLALQTAIQPLEPSQVFLADELFVTRCMATPLSLVLLFFQAVVLAYGVFATRQMRQTDFLNYPFDDSASLAASIYNVFLVVVVLAAINFTVDTPDVLVVFEVLGFMMVNVTVCYMFCWSRIWAKEKALPFSRSGTNARMSARGVSSTEDRMSNSSPGIEIGKMASKGNSAPRGGSREPEVGPEVATGFSSSHGD